jgi:hypothetical protein
VGNEEVQVVKTLVEIPQKCGGKEENGLEEELGCGRGVGVEGWRGRRAFCI